MELEPIGNSGRLGDNIQVVLRVRPLNEREIKLGGKKCVELSPSSDAQILLDTMNSRTNTTGAGNNGTGRPSDANALSRSTFLSASMLNLPPEPKSFEFDWVAGENSNQFEMFQRIGVPIADACLQGYNCTVCAYGQTGAGKTYTMQGRGLTMSDLSNPNLHSDIHTGLQTRVLDYLFRKASETKQATLIKCSYIEIYNESIKDLLNPSSGSLQLRENVQKGVFIDKVTEEVVKTSYDVLALLARGIRNRHVGSTNMNDESSRSHTVLTVTFESQRLTNGVQKLVTSKLHFVDLAGSERQKKTNTQGDQLKEAAKINQSLSTLGEVINTLASSRSKKVHIKYRNSKLTYLLRDSLGGNSKTTIIANISPAADNYSETLSTLQFAQRAKTIENKASINEETAGDFENLKAENNLLKEKLIDLQVLLKEVQEKAVLRENLKAAPQPTADECELLMQLNHTALEAERKTLEFEEELKDLHQRLKYEYLKRDEFKQLFDKACDTGSQQEHSLKLMVRLFQHRETRLREHSWDLDSEVKFLKEQVQVLEASAKCQPVVMQVFQENLQLKQQIIYANVDGKPNANMLRVMNLLRQNLTYLESFGTKLEQSIEDREKLAKRFEKLRLMQGGTSDQFRQVFTEEENEELKQKLEALSLQLMNRTQLEEELYKKIEKQKADLLEEQQEHEKTKSELKAEIKSLEDRITELNQSYAEVQNEGQETNSRFAVKEVELKDKIIGLELKKSELLKKLDRNEQRSAEERRMFEEKYTALNQKTQHLNLDVMRLTEELTVKKQTLLKVKDENGLLKSENQSLQVRLQKQSDDSSRLTQFLHEKDQELLVRKAEQEKELFALQNQVESSQREAEEYRQDNESLYQKIDMLQQEIDSLNESNIYMKDLAEARASEVLALQEQLTNFRRQEINQVSNETEQLYQKLKQTAEWGQSLEKQLQEVTQSETNFRSAFFESKGDLERVTGKYAEALEVVKQREQEMDELRTQIQQLSQEREEEKQELQNVQAQLSSLTDEKEIIHMVSKSQEAQLKDHATKQKKFEDELRNTHDKVAKLQMNLMTVQQQADSSIESLQLQMRSINEQNKFLIAEKNQKEVELDKLQESSDQRMAELINQLKEAKHKVSSLQSSTVESIEVEDLTNQGEMLARAHMFELEEKNEEIKKLRLDVKLKKQLLSEQQRKYAEIKKKGEEELQAIKTNSKRHIAEVLIVKECYQELMDENAKLKAQLCEKQQEIRLLEDKLRSKDFDLSRLSSFGERVSERNETLELEIEGLKRAKTKMLKHVREHENTKEGVSSHDLNIIAVHVDSETAANIKQKQKEQKALKARQGTNTTVLDCLADNLTLYSDEKELLQQIMQVLDELKLVDSNKQGSYDSDDFEGRLDFGNSSAKKKRRDDSGLLRILQKFYRQVLAFKSSSQEHNFKLRSYDVLALKVAKLDNEVERMTQRRQIDDRTNLSKMDISSYTINKKPQYFGKENQPKENKSALKDKRREIPESNTALKKRETTYVGIVDSSEASAGEDDDVVCMGNTAGKPRKTHSRRLKAHENQKKAAQRMADGAAEFFDSNAPTPKKF